MNISMENRPSSALFKRAEQLKRWEESDTNRESSTPSLKSKKIQFSLECVFLAACACSDKEEVLRLLNVGANIDTSNVDGLSALHQACIDDNLDMVEFLVEHGADINKGDNEGWSPLHATASCGFISIAKYLIEHGADIAAVNNDGELAVDIAESDEMEDLLHAVLKEKGIDLDEARNKEERLMMQHAYEWLNSGTFEDIPHDKTGATALHVAASKGYIKVMDLLIQAGADVNAQDFDGWTPLHAAAHWGQKESCEILVENFCDMDKKNYVAQTVFDVSEGEIVRLLEDLRKKQSSLHKENPDINTIMNKIAHLPKRRFSSNDKLLKDHDEVEDRQSQGQLILEEDGFHMDKVRKVELKIETDMERKNNISEEKDKHIRVNNDDRQNAENLPDVTNKVPMNSVPSMPPPKSVIENEDVRIPSWRKPVSLKNMLQPYKYEDEKQWTASSDQVNINCEDKAPEVVLRRTQSFEGDDKFYRRYCELKARIESGNARPTLISLANNATSLPIRSASLKEKYRNKLMHEDVLPPPTLIAPASNAVNGSSPSTMTHDTNAAVVQNALIRSGVTNAVSISSPIDGTTVSAPTTPITSKLSPGNIFKNFFKSFVPPVRDEESETQRKAHAKRVRETRRSTQGVTLEEFKSAEQLVKKKQQQQQQLQQATNQLNSSIPTAEQPFMLEDVRTHGKDVTCNDVSPTNWTVTPTDEWPDTANVTLPLRKNNKFNDDSEQSRSDKDKNSIFTQPINPRRKRTKRRSTGAVTFDVEELNERLNPEIEAIDSAAAESGAEKNEPSSRLGSVSSLGENNQSSNQSSTPNLPNENGELDYKKLYEETLADNERLREKLKKSEEELMNCKLRLTDSSSPAVVNKNSLSELEKREKRAMERKLSEMEEELKQINQIKQENQRLKDENGALIRVISKLSK